MQISNAVNSPQLQIGPMFVLKLLNVGHFDFRPTDKHTDGPQNNRILGQPVFHSHFHIKHCCTV